MKVTYLIVNMGVVSTSRLRLSVFQYQPYDTSVVGLYHLSLFFVFFVEGLCAVHGHQIGSSLHFICKHIGQMKL